MNKKGRKKVNTANCFILPDGKIIKILPLEHEAYLINNKIRYSETWLKVSDTWGGCYMLMMGDWDIEKQVAVQPTQAQIDSLFDLSKKFGLKFELDRFLKHWEVK